MDERSRSPRVPPASDPGGRLTRTLLISHDVIGASMAGPGIRYYHLARELAPFVDLRLALLTVDAGPEQTLPAPGQLDGIELTTYRKRDWDSISPAARWADVIILPTDIATEFPQLADLDAALVIDGYDPLLAEWLALFSDLPPAQREHAWFQRMRELHAQYLMGDFYICASERQRLWWLGQLEAAGRLHPETFQADPSLHNLVDIAPYGLREDPPVHAHPVARGVWPGIDPDDKLILWGGGLWPWLDPVTAIRAAARIRERRQDVKLLFPGTRHPNPIMQGMPTQNEAAFAAAEELGLRDSCVFFGDWVPYNRWPSLLLECDVALSLHYDTVETQLAFRSRLFDYIWASLPSVVTQGDATSDLVTRYDLGHVVDYEDVGGVADAILALLDEPAGARRANFQTAQVQLTWRSAAEPLIRFCQHPRRAPDRVAGTTDGVPYYHAQLQENRRQLEEAQTRVAELEALVRGYESGKVMRAMQGFDRWRARLTGGDHG